MASECRGLGGKIDASEAERLAELLIARKITEIEEAIALLGRYRDFPRGQPGNKGSLCMTARENTGLWVERAKR